MKRFNLYAATPRRDATAPPGYQAGSLRFGPTIGAERIGATLYELEPGNSICPYHYEYGEEEWLIVLEGRPTLRHPGGEDDLERGDVVAFPVGPAGAHKVTNHTDDTVRVMMLSTIERCGLVVYPDSDKVLAYADNPDDRLLVKRESNLGDAGYWLGETPAET
jgi:uncharacterized cupin superfamily protein